MPFRVTIAGFLLTMALCSTAQQPAPAPSDPILDTASSYIGRALFLRCFCADNNLTFSAEGHLPTPGKATDWTLAAFNLQKVERKAPGTLQLEGVRVAIRYAADRHEFERHPQNDVKVHITLPDPGDPKRLDDEMAAIFSVGIDLPLQRSMPPYWRHYFDQKLEWPQDELTGQPIYAFLGAQAKNSAVVPPSVDHRADSAYTNEAQHDHVRGVVQLHLVVDPAGEARRIAIAQPLGYGLDEKAVEMMSKFRFHPATDNGKPVAATILLQQEYVPIQLPH